MQRRFILFLLFLGGSLLVQSQDTVSLQAQNSLNQDSSHVQIDSIEIHAKWYGISFWQKDKALSNKELYKIVESNPEAKKWMKKADNLYGFSMVVGFVGGALIGWPFGEAFGGAEEPKWFLAVAGAGLLLFVGIPLSVSYTNYATKAVNAYNESLPHKKALEFQIGVLNNGVGLRMSF